MSLLLHAGAEPVDYAALRELKTPEPTATHVPLAHYRVVDLIKATLNMYGHVVEDEHYGVTPDGANFFAALSLKSTYGNYADVCGLRNSHTKKFPVGIAFGSRVFVCDNLAFVADHVIRTKHTAKLKQRLPGLVSGLIEPLADQREALYRKLKLYQDTPLTDSLADHAIMSMFRQGVIGVQRIADVHQAWQEPPHDWGERTAWRLFNSATYALTGKVAENPKGTADLHEIIDGVCEVVS
jgi:hypothetical protein